uniref:Uncharacterized protein n=1 Tax=Solanum lycopersicum TaxID=4081 RepID=A0A3Q7EWN1_SOLLC
MFKLGRPPFKDMRWVVTSFKVTCTPPSLCNFASNIKVHAASPGDEDAIQCKVVALVKADSIEETLVAIKDSSKKSSLDLSFFKGYCFYRQNKLEEALEFLEGARRKY